MKHVLFFIAIALFVLSAAAQEFSFDSTSHNAGDIPEAEFYYFNFHFKNTGTAPLVISECRKSCGCTQPECPKEAIQPGESGVIQVGYNTENRPGPFTKPVTVISNALTKP